MYFGQLPNGGSFRLPDKEGVYTKMNEYDAQDPNGKVVPMEIYQEIIPPNIDPPKGPKITIMTPDQVEQIYPGVMVNVQQALSNMFGHKCNNYGMCGKGKLPDETPEPEEEKVFPELDDLQLELPGVDNPPAKPFPLDDIDPIDA